jgi:hypothetical protein
MNWLLVVSSAIVAVVYIGAGMFGQTPSGWTRSTSA